MARTFLLQGGTWQMPLSLLTERQGHLPFPLISLSVQNLHFKQHTFGLCRSIFCHKRQKLAKLFENYSTSKCRCRHIRAMIGTALKASDSPSLSGNGVLLPHWSATGQSESAARRDVIFGVWTTVPFYVILQARMHRNTFTLSSVPERRKGYGIIRGNASDITHHW